MSERHYLRRIKIFDWSKEKKIVDCINLLTGVSFINISILNNNEKQGCFHLATTVTYCQSIPSNHNVFNSCIVLMITF